MKPPLTTGVKVHAHVAPETRAELERIAREHHRTVAAELRHALAEHIERERPREKDA